MPGLFGNLVQASKALAAHQRAIQVTGRNLANINNPEYARQRVLMGDRYVTQTPQGPEGTGVEVLAVQQLRDSFLDRQVVRQASDNGFLQAQYDALSNAALALGDRIDRATDPASLGDIANSPTGIAAALDQFFNGMDALAATPNDLPAKIVAVQGAEALAERINLADERLDILQADLEDELVSNLKEANALLSDIANLNFLIRQADSVMSGGGADLIDARQAKLERLSRLVKIEVTPESDSSNEVRVRISGKDAVVYGMKQGDLSYNLGLRTSPVTYKYSATGGSMNSNVLNILPSEAANLSVGMQVRGTGVSGSYVTAVNHVSGEITLSAPLSANASGVYYFDGKAGIQWTDGSGVPVNIVIAGGEAQGRYAAVSSGGVAGARASLEALALALKTEVNAAYDPVDPFFLSPVSSNSGLLSVNVAPGSLKTSSTGKAGDNSYILNIAKLRTVPKDIIISKPGSTFSSASPTLVMSDVTGLKAGMAVSGTSIFAGSKIRSVNASAVPPTITLDNNTTGASVVGGNTLTFTDNKRLLDYTRGMVIDLATLTQSASSRLEEATVLETALRTQRDSVSAVSLDEETTDLMRFQKAYQANAKVISVIDEMLQSLIAMVR